MFHILQCGLADYHSHYYTETLAEIAACRDLNIDLKLYANQAAPRPILAETGAAPLFRDVPDALFRVDPTINHLADFIMAGERFAADCAGLSAAGVDRGDIVFVPHARIRHLHGLARWLGTLPPDGRPIVALRFDDPDESWIDAASPGRFTDGHAFTRFAITELLMLVPAHRLLLFATTTVLARIVATLTRRPCARIPLAKFYPRMDEMAAMRTPSRDGRPHICVAGEFREEKGAKLMPDIVTRFARRFPHTTLSLQVNRESQAQAVRQILDERGAAVELNVQIGECSRHDHYARMLAADIVLMPYLQSRYIARASGIFAEAVACGLPVVVPRLTWMAEQLALGRAAGTSFAAFTAESVVDALIAATETLADLTVQARTRQAAWHAQENVSEAIGLLMKAASS
ncbi:MAG TPA: glycosyltransferase [Alphaproteobacteria bacterium]|jgi:glycosyltransferase involved in cell wall biosynthesis|nr:glycosyltransferase [Alphaproteobacteria bacterium]